MSCVCDSCAQRVHETKQSDDPAQTLISVTVELSSELNEVLNDAKRVDKTLSVRPPHTADNESAGEMMNLC